MHDWSSIHYALTVGKCIYSMTSDLGIDIPVNPQSHILSLLLCLGLNLCKHQVFRGVLRKLVHGMMCSENTSQSSTQMASCPPKCIVPCCRGFAINDNILILLGLNDMAESTMVFCVHWIFSTTGFGLLHNVHHCMLDSELYCVVLCNLLLPP